MSAKKNDPPPPPAKGGKQLAPTKPQGASGMAVHDYGADAGAGFENTSQADFAIPFLILLQSMSPQCTKSEPEFRKDAEPGMLMDSVSGELMPGDEGVIVVPCVTSHVFTEWLPREKGGGFKGVHQIDSDLVKAVRAAAGKSVGKLVTDEGTELIETFYVFGVRLSSVDATEPAGFFMIPFTSTKIKKYRQAMYRLHTVKGNPPLFAHRIKIVSVPEKNNKGSFFNFDIQPALADIASSMIPPMLGDKPHPILVAAKEFKAKIDSGAARGAFETARNAGSETPTDDAVI